MQAIQISAYLPCGRLLVDLLDELRGQRMVASHGGDHQHRQHNSQRQQALHVWVYGEVCSSLDNKHTKKKVVNYIRYIPK